MIPGLNPKKAAQMMQRMGIQQTEIQATEVIIKTPDKMLVFHNPSVSKINMMGQSTYQIVGEPIEQSTALEINDDDIETVAEQAGVPLDEARKAIEESSGDLAEAIMHLKKQD